VSWGFVVVVSVRKEGAEEKKKREGSGGAKGEKERK